MAAGIKMLSNVYEYYSYPCPLPLPHMHSQTHSHLPQVSSMEQASIVEMVI